MMSLVSLISAVMNDPDASTKDLAVLSSAQNALRSGKKPLEVLDQATVQAIRNYAPDAYDDLAVRLEFPGSGGYLV